MATVDPATLLGGHGTLQHELGGDASAAAFLLGGIGAGNISIGARGELRDWEIFNSPAKGRNLPFSFFALRVAQDGCAPTTRILESRLRPPYDSQPESLGGLPRIFDSRLRGEYPFVWVDFLDAELPVAVTLEAFTPLIPLDAASSGLPAAVLRYRVRNVTDAACEVTVAASLFNPIGCRFEPASGRVSHLRATPSTEFRTDGDLRGLFMSSTLASDDLQHGTLALLTAGEDVTATVRWPIGGEGASGFWTDLDRDGRLEPRSNARRMDEIFTDDPPIAEIPEEIREQDRALHAASLANKATLAAGEACAYDFVLAWHFPNRSRSWGPKSEAVQLLEPTRADEIVRNHYATWLNDAWEVARHLIDNLPALESQTRAFHESLYASTLPREIVDAAASNIAALRSTTCFWLEDGTFAGWEGCSDDAGCCPGSCTHVWNYAQTAAFLFPELEQSMRRIEFALETSDDGRMQFRSNRLFDSKPWNFLPAVDGQLGSIIRLYREWKFTGDDAFLIELWPKAAKALEFAFDHWDSDGDFVLDGRQHNTYDIEFYGPNPLAASLFYAALHAGAEMAEHLGDPARADRFRRAASLGAETFDRQCWNGEYYIQLLDEQDEKPNQHGVGCLSDQLLGQFAAHVTGLGYVLPRDHVRQAIASVYRYNFRRNLRGHRNFFSAFALEDEGGLLLCTWPFGGRPRYPLHLGDVVWTGIEYQVAAHLIFEGFVEEGLEIVRAVRDRYDGYKRSPWNEAECGNHYARSLASWALLLAYSGYHYDAIEQAIEFVPAVAGDFRCFFSTGSGWGTFERTSGSAKLRLLYGTLVVSQFKVDHTTRTYQEPVMLSVGDTLSFR
jgi:D-arabinan exo beta-(1,2)-arabinofuranosidase (non-reducing end)